MNGELRGTHQNHPRRAPSHFPFPVAHVHDAPEAQEKKATTQNWVGQSNHKISTQLSMRSGINALFLGSTAKTMGMTKIATKEEVILNRQRSFVFTPFFPMKLKRALKSSHYYPIPINWTKRKGYPRTKASQKFTLPHLCRFQIFAVLFGWITHGLDGLISYSQTEANSLIELVHRLASGVEVTRLRRYHITTFPVYHRLDYTVANSLGGETERGD